MPSATTKDLLRKVQKMVPPMLEKFHKGQLGRVAVIGGSEDYTGAPYFSAMASARLGADMVCYRPIGSSGPQDYFRKLTKIILRAMSSVIKTYSPNLMVHPYMRQSKNLLQSENVDNVSSNVISMLSRLHVIVIGPGLGRDELMQETCARVITEARKQNMPFVLDADGLYLAQTRPDLVQGYKECILTPNVVEFGRLAKVKGIDMNGDPTQLCSNLAKAFGGVTIIQKGGQDYISNGEHTLVNDLPGGLKRSGGQGDTLTGSLATLLAYRKAYLDRIWDHDNDLSPSELLTLAAFGASSVTRESSRLAFEKNGRSLQASDLTEMVHVAFNNLIGEPDAKL
ncbi:MAG: hypothetical protein M1819_004989 [Sarea resinae]|nr:MAG: hypothetical protein M1819_004989 [Sarea resinae]